MWTQDFFNYFSEREKTEMAQVLRIERVGLGCLVLVCDAKTKEKDKHGLTEPISLMGYRPVMLRTGQQGFWTIYTPDYPDYGFFLVAENDIVEAFQQAKEQIKERLKADNPGMFVNVW